MAVPQNLEKRRDHTCHHITSTMLLNFIKQFTPDGEVQPVYQLSKIFLNYWNKGLMTDFLTLIPLPFIFHFWEWYYLWYAVKILRLQNGVSLFDVTAILQAVKDGMKKYIDRKIKYDPSIAEDNLDDHNNIVFILVVGYLFKTLKLIVIIMNISYFLGMFWLTFCFSTREL